MQQLSCLSSLQELKVRPASDPQIVGNVAASRSPSQYLPVLSTTLTQLTSLGVTKCVEGQEDAHWLVLLQKFQRLQELELWYEVESPHDVLQLQTLPSLTTLKLHNNGCCRVEGALAQLTQLQSLTVVGGYTFTSAVRLASLTNLKDLCLEGAHYDVLYLRKQVSRQREFHCHCNYCLFKTH